MDTIINLGIIITYIFVGLAVGTIFFFAFKTLVKDFKKATTTLAGIGIIVLIFLVSFIISNPADISPEFFEKNDANPAFSKIIGSGLIMLYLIILVSIVAIIYSQVSKILRK